MSNNLKGINLSTPVQYLKGVGPRAAAKLAKLEIHCVNELIRHYPSRYLDYSLVTPINLIQEGETITIKGKVVKISNEYTRGGKKLQKGVVKDQTGDLDVIWFNQPFLVKNIKIGREYYFSGKVNQFSRRKHLISPEYEVVDNPSYSKYKTLHTGRLVPVYPEIKSVTSKYLRKLIAQALPLVKPEIKEFLPFKILTENNLLAEKEAVEKIHFPENKIAADKARQRLAFDEMFLIQLKANLKKLVWKKEGQAPALPLKKTQKNQFAQSLPFKLTKAQKRVIQEILVDISSTSPMNRLLQGDVGSGKTVVTAFAILSAFLNQRQTIVAAPTEVLAFQHYLTYKSLLKLFGVRIVLITGATKRSVKSGNWHEFDLVIGTHALINHHRQLDRLGLVIIDEQHRFGVAQRALLAQKVKSTFPHLLTLTATPIPRTVALTLHGDLEMSILDEMPPGRKEVITKVVTAKQRSVHYQWIKTQVKKGNQVFIICPFVEPSETNSSVRAAKEEFARLKKSTFSDLKLGLLHGRMKAKEKKNILKKMTEQKIDILVSTPVVEVGIDIPHASIILVEGAERFGLAQLHQLRGRVGRNKQKSYCFLLTENPGKKALKRLRAMKTINNGMVLAEADLAIRGPGEIFGLRQHGLAKLKMASLFDLPLIIKTRQIAQKLLEQDPQLRQYPLLGKKLARDKEQDILN